MTDIRDVIAALKSEIEAGRRELESKEAALRILQERCGVAQPAQQVKVQTPAAGEHGHEGDLLDLSSLVIEDTSRKRTFVDELRDMLRRFGAQEFSITHAEAALKRLGVEVAGKTPRSRISASLSKLNEDGFIVKTFTGGGNVPNRYRLRSSMPESEALRLEALARVEPPAPSKKQPSEALAALATAGVSVDDSTH